MRRISTAAASLLLFAAVANAQQHPNQDRGFSPDRVFASGDIDSVNTFNGNLVVSIPIGQPYPVNAFNYRFMLVYNSNGWDHVPGIFPGTSSPCTRTLPNRRANAGMGWLLSLGHLLAPNDPLNNTRPTPGQQPVWWIYETADGQDHVLYDRLHGGTPTANVFYSRDGTYIRMTLGSSAVVELPDGTKHTYDNYGATAYDWQLTKIEDRFGNNLHVFYEESDLPEYGTMWRITDSIGRTHRVYFEEFPTSPLTSAVARIDLAAFNGATASYLLNHDLQTIARGEGDTCTPSGQPKQDTVPLLRSIMLPSVAGSSAGFTELTYGMTGGPPNTSGALLSLRLPTRGMLLWDYARLAFPDTSTDKPYMRSSVGVIGRKMLDAGGTPIAAWTYVHALGPRRTCPSIPRDATDDPYEITGGVIGPDHTGTFTYYSVHTDADVCPVPEGWDPSDYALPISHSTEREQIGTIDGVPWLASGEVRSGCTASLADCTGAPLRLQFSAYDQDAFVSDTSGIGDRNRTLRASRTRYEQDAACGPQHNAKCYTEQIGADLGAYGKYRLSILGGNFASGSDRTTFTDYPRTEKAVGDPWVLNTFTQQCAGDVRVAPSQAINDCSGFAHTLRTNVCFDGNGFLKGRRSLSLVPGRPDLDVTALYTGIAGNVVSEDFYGGDDTPLRVANPFSICNDPAAPGQYRLLHTYAGGALATSIYAGTSSYVVDRTIDINSGLIAASRTASGPGFAGLATSYLYDVRGRITDEQPVQGAWTRYLYADATSSSPPAASVASRPFGAISGATLTKTDFAFDVFGRLVQSTRQMPNGATATREVTYDASGRKATETEWHGSDSPYIPTTSYQYDPLGRVQRITPADGPAHDVGIDYTGSGVREVARTVRIATSASGAEQDATTTEEYDAAQRLIRVTEPSDNNANVDTRYSYDVADHLLTVTTASQPPRTFGWDARGFLTAETHPESGTASFGEYDAKGHAHRRVDANGTVMAFAYDAAERMLSVSENGAPLKAFTYDRPNSGNDFSLGKLSTAVRHNRHPSLPGGDVTVTETYSYAGTDGRPSAKTTATSTGQTFTTSFTWDDLGNPTSIAYPQCSAGCPAVGAPARTIANVFDSGLMKQVNGYADIAYSGNGLVNAITHRRASGALGPVWTQSSDRGMTRPLQIQVTGHCDDLGINIQPADRAVTSGFPAGLKVTASGAASYQWYEQLAGGAVLISGQITDTLTIPISSQRRFWVRVANGTCTIDSAIATVSVSDTCPAPNATISGPTAVNAGASATASVPAASGATCAWTISGGTFTSPANGNAVSYTAGCAGQVVLNVTVSASCGSSASGSLPVTIASPSSTITSDPQTIDPGEAARIDVALIGTPPWTLTWQDGFVQANITSSPATRSPHPSQTTTYAVMTMSDASGCSGTPNGSVQVTVRPLAPIAVIAAATSATSVAIDWIGTEGGTSFVVYRSAGGAFAQIGTAVGTHFDDAAAQANTAYLYRVQSVRDGVASALSVADVATTVVFNDDPLVPLTSVVNAVHVTQLRTAVSAMRATAGIPAVAYTDAPLSAGTLVKAVHIAELRTALNAARLALGLSAIGYADPPPAAGAAIKATDVMDLRRGVR